MARILPLASFSNLTLLLVTVSLGVVLISGRTDLALSRLRRALNQRALVALIVLCATIQAMLGLYKGYVVPRDVMQDLISAREYLSGRSPYPTNMTAIFMEWVKTDPPTFSLVAQWPDRKAREDEARLEAASSHWVQAHPPVMTLAVAPFVAVLGYRGTYFALTAVSLACLAITFRLIVRGLDLQPTRREALAIGFALLGWTATLTLIRNGQTGLILECLLVLAWFGLKRGRPVTAGIAVAIAASVKLYPGLELAYLWHRHRRAYFTSLGVIALILVGSAGLCGWYSFVEHAATAGEVVARYADYPTNNSLLGVLVRSFRLAGGTDHQARVAYVTIAVIVVCGCVWMTRPRAGEREESRALDVSYSLFMALIPLLSPVSWDHYQVILMLPLAVVGKRVLATGASRWPLLGFLCILFVMAVPENGYSTLSEWSRPFLGTRLAEVLVMSLPATAVSVLGLWLAVLVVRLSRVESESKIVSEGLPC